MKNQTPFGFLEKPFLARAYVAPLLGKEDKQLNLKKRFDALLASIGPKDVVLSDPATSWPIPSSAGRIVSALHPEWFSPDERERKTQVSQFFSLELSPSQRIEIIKSRNVRWIVLNREMLSKKIFDSLYDEHAVASQDSGLVLMDVPRWIEGNHKLSKYIAPSSSHKNDSQTLQ